MSTSWRRKRSVDISLDADHINADTIGPRVRERWVDNRLTVGGARVGRALKGRKLAAALLGAAFCARLSVANWQPLPVAANIPAPCTVTTLGRRLGTGRATQIRQQPNGLAAHG